MQRRAPQKHHQRRGAAIVEMAVLLPLLVCFIAMGIDFCRIFYFSSVINNCARNGALYASDPNAAAESPYDSTQEAALADASGISPTPTVTSATKVDGNGNPCVEVTVSYSFQTITQYPGIPSTINLTRKVQARTVPTLPVLN